MIAIRSCLSSLLTSRVYPRSNRQKAATGSPCFVVRSLVSSGLVFISLSLSRGSRLRDTKVGLVERNSEFLAAAPEKATLRNHVARAHPAACDVVSSRAHFVPPTCSRPLHVSLASCPALAGTVPSSSRHVHAPVATSLPNFPVERSVARRESRRPRPRPLSMSSRALSRTSPTLSSRASGLSPLAPSPHREPGVTFRSGPETSGSRADRFARSRGS